MTLDTSRICSAVIVAVALLSSVAPAQQAAPGPGAGVVPARRLRMLAGQVDTSRPRIARLEDAAIGDQDRLVVQFAGPLSAQQRRDLTAAGVKLLDYLPDDAYVVRVPKAARGAVPHARWAAKFDASWKLSPTVATRVLQNPERRALAQAGRSPVVITAFSDAQPEEVADLMRAIAGVPGAIVHDRADVGGNLTVWAELPTRSLGALAALPAVQFIEEAPEVTERNLTTRWIVQSNIPGQTPLYANGLTGAGQVIGIVDSRPDVNHCSFFDAVPFGPAHRKILAYNATTANPASHGTHVAGIACGDAGAEDETRGVAYGAKFVYSPIPAFTEEGILNVLTPHHAQGARIHTNSWGDDGTTSYSSLCRGIDVFMNANEDDLVLFACSNSPVLTSPENCKNALAVGATQNSPNQDFFCYGGVGPTADGRRKPEVFAPGCDIQSAQVNSGCSTFAQGGTSMATPAVAGAATLVRQYFTDGYYPSGTPTSGDAMTPSGALVKAVVLNSSTDMTGYAGAIPNSSEGWGRVLLDSTLYFPGDARRLVVRDVRNTDGMTTGGQSELALTVNGSAEPLRVTLAWTDKPASAGAALTPVNNLDLEVVAPDSTLYKGNVFAGGVSVSGGAADSLNNVEQVLIPAPTPGLWTIRVKGTAVNQGTQGYALVSTGDLAVPPAPLTIAVSPPRPTIIAPDTNQQFGVTINPGADTLVPGTALVFWRRHPGDAFASSPLFALGGDQYRATLPRFACSDSPQFYLQAAGAATGTIAAPPNSPTAQAFAASVGVSSTSTLLSEGFESGLPAGWSVTGLWHITGSCPQSAPCDGSQWGYFGQDTTCTYATPNRESGLLSAPAINLPAAAPGRSIQLSYCSYLEREQANGYDLAKLLVNGLVADQPSANSIQWATRTVDLTPYAGQTVTIAWSFDTVDNFLNNFKGWQIDGVRLTVTEATCTAPAPCSGDLNSDRQVTTPDLTLLLSRFGTTGEAFATGDLNGDGLVNTSDLTLLLVAFGQPCP